MANLVTNSEQKGIIATKIAKVNEEVSFIICRCNKQKIGFF